MSLLLVWTRSAQFYGILGYLEQKSYHIEASFFHQLTVDYTQWGPDDSPWRFYIYSNKTNWTLILQHSQWALNKLIASHLAVLHRFYALKCTCHIVLIIKAEFIMCLAIILNKHSFVNSFMVMDIQFYDTNVYFQNLNSVLIESFVC